MKNLTYYFLLFILLITSCTGSNPTAPYVYNVNPRYTQSSVDFYGSYYKAKGNDNNVLEISFLSDSLEVTSSGSIVGIGQHLYLGDVFVPSLDSTLSSGVYKIENSGKAFSVLAGRNDTVNGEIISSGASIYYYESNVTKSITRLVKGGTFTVTRVPGRYTVVFDLVTADNKSLKGMYNGPLIVNKQLAPRR